VTSPTEPGRSDSEPLKPLPSAGAFLGMGTSVAGCVAVGVFAGVWLDGRAHTSPLFLVVGLLLGLASAVATVVVQVRRFL
jgi:ATP synthase protein I